MRYKLIDVVTSAWNEEDCLPELFSRLDKTLSSLKGYKWRITVFDNGSSDRTWNIICKEAKTNKNIRGFRMSRNFNLDAALTAGLDMCEGDIAILMASDLQDPPEIIPKLIAEYEKGFNQVLVRVISRPHVPKIRRFLSIFFYKSANWITDGMLPEMVSDFRLLDKTAYKSLRKLRESHRFLRGLGAWIGFKTSSVEISRPERFSGKSKWLNTSLRNIIEYALKSIYSHTTKPLTWVTYSGLILGVLSFTYLCVMSAIWLLTDTPFDGFGTIVGFLLFGFSVTLTAMGIVSQYIALIFEEVKRRPIYIISEYTESSFKFLNK